MNLTASPAPRADDAQALPRAETSQRALDPMDRLSEVLFGLIMVLTFTGSLSAAEAGREEVRSLLVAALGCNIAWGIVDAVMYLMACLTDRADAWRLASAFREAASPAAARAVLASALPPAVARVAGERQLESMREALAETLVVPSRPRLHAQDWLGAVAVFFLVTLSTFPVVIPFLLVREPMVALRISNAVAIVMMFLTGFAFGRLSGMRPWLMGLAMVALGAVLVGVTIALGG